MPLTDLQLRALPFHDGQRDIPDRDGLFIRIGKTRKTWMLTLQRPKRHRLTLGHYPELGLSKAREKARELQAASKHLKAEPPTLTFEEVLEQFYRNHDARALSRAECRRLLDMYFRPSLAPKSITAIKTADVVPLIDAIPSKSTRRNAHVYLRAFFNWSYQRGHLDQSPIARLSPPASTTARERVLDDSELVRVWNAAPATDYGLIIRLCILSGQRIGQWSRFKPDYLHTESNLIFWPAEAMKANKPHILPLTPAILDLIQRRSNLIPWKQPDGRSKARLDRHSGVTDWTHHDLRRTWATVSAETIGTPPHIIEAVLAHAHGSAVSRTYNRAGYLKPMREALEGFDDYLTQLLLTE